jgi:hypothetical protein
MGGWIGQIRALTYRDEAIGEQQPSSFVLYDGEAKGSAQEAGEVTAQGNDRAGHSTCFIGET